MVNELEPSWVALHQGNNGLAIRVKVGGAAEVVEVKRQQILTRHDGAALAKGAIPRKCERGIQLLRK
jgi:hypothetical protein